MVECCRTAHRRHEEISIARADPSCQLSVRLSLPNHALKTREAASGLNLGTETAGAGYCQPFDRLPRSECHTANAVSGGSRTFVLEEAKQTPVR